MMVVVAGKLQTKSVADRSCWGNRGLCQLVAASAIGVRMVLQFHLSCKHSSELTVWPGFHCLYFILRWGRGGKVCSNSPVFRRW